MRLRLDSPTLFPSLASTRLPSANLRPQGESRSAGQEAPYFTFMVPSFQPLQDIPKNGKTPDLQTWQLGEMQQGSRCEYVEVVPADHGERQSGC